jgi:methylthioribose-1-phosphate isomerase
MTDRPTLPPTVRWHADLEGHLELLDQTRLPGEELVLAIQRLDPLIDAIKRLSVRGAPAIGVAAAYGMVLGVRERAPNGKDAFLTAVDAVGEKLAASRPTAVNLRWAVDRLRARARREPTLAALLDEARATHREDEELCKRMGEAGASLIRDGMTVLTHCNAGRLATAGDGTALAVLFAAHRRGRRFQVFADETRPLLQGSRLTALELHAAGIPVNVLADSAAAGLIARGEVDLIITGADRIAANGDVANKVGTYGLSLAARAHGIPMYVAAPISTFDLSIPDGSHIPIEDRDPDEILTIGGRRLAPPGIGARNPAFDVTPAAHLAGLITDRGLIAPVTAERIKAVLG